MSHVIEAVLKGSARTANTVAKRKARLEASKARLTDRQNKARNGVKRAEEALKKAKERLAKAKAKVESTDQYAAALVEKQTTELQAAEKFHAATVVREQERGDKAVKKTAPAGMVETEGGARFDLSKDVVKTIASVLGHRRKGILSPLEGEDAQSIIKAIDSVIPGDLGDVFTVTIRGLRTTFTVEEEGLAFETTTK